MRVVRSNFRPTARRFQQAPLGRSPGYHLSFSPYPGARPHSFILARPCRSSAPPNLDTHRKRTFALQFGAVLKNLEVEYAPFQRLRAFWQQNKTNATTEFLCLSACSIFETLGEIVSYYVLGQPVSTVAAGLIGGIAGGYGFAFWRARRNNPDAAARDAFLLVAINEGACVPAGTLTEAVLGNLMTTSPDPLNPLNLGLHLLAFPFAFALALPAMSIATYFQAKNAGHWVVPKGSLQRLCTYLRTQLDHADGNQPDQWKIKETDRRMIISRAGSRLVIEAKKLTATARKQGHNAADSIMITVSSPHCRWNHDLSHSIQHFMESAFEGAGITPSRVSTLSCCAHKHGDDGRLHDEQRHEERLHVCEGHHHD